VTTARDEELLALRRPFAIGAGCVVLAVVAIGVVVGLFGTGADRPAGVAERWLVAVGDTTREGIEDDGRERALELGASPELAERAGVPFDAARLDGERAFESVRVGRAERSGSVGDDAVEREAFEVTPYESEPFAGHAYLLDGDDGWEVMAIAREGQPGAVLEVVTSGIDLGPVPPGAVVVERPERAPIGWFVGALLLGGLITLGCVAAVRAATPKPT
jgi:hypothetical protein